MLIVPVLQMGTIVKKCSFQEGWWFIMNRGKVEVFDIIRLFDMESAEVLNNNFTERIWV